MHSICELMKSFAIIGGINGVIGIGFLDHTNKSFGGIMCRGKMIFGCITLILFDDNFDRVFWQQQKIETEFAAEIQSVLVT